MSDYLQEYSITPPDYENLWVTTYWINIHGLKKQHKIKKQHRKHSDRQIDDLTVQTESNTVVYTREYTLN